MITPEDIARMPHFTSDDSQKLPPNTFVVVDGRVHETDSNGFIAGDDDEDGGIPSDPRFTFSVSDDGTIVDGNGNPLP